MGSHLTTSLAAVAPSQLIKLPTERRMRTSTRAGGRLCCSPLFPFEKHRNQLEASRGCEGGGQKFCPNVSSCLPYLKWGPAPYPVRRLPCTYILLADALTTRKGVKLFMEIWRINKLTSGMGCEGLKGQPKEGGAKALRMFAFIE